MRTMRIVAALVVAAFVCAGQAEAQTEGRPCEAEPTDETIAYGDLLTCQVGVLGDSDLFRFQGFAGEVVSVRVTDHSPANVVVDCTVEWFRPNLTSLGSATNPTTCEVRATLDASGLFTIRVTEAGNNSLMNYAVEISRFAPTPTSALSINPGDTLTNRVDPPGDADSFIFSGVSGDTVSIRVTDLSPANVVVDAVVELFAPDGTRVGAHGHPTTAMIQTTLTQSGLYVARVTEGGDNSTMSYHIEYQCLQGGCPTTTQVKAAFGLGPKTGAGWFAAMKDLSGNLGVAAWGRLPWPAYNGTGGGVRLAAGDVDGDGLDEIVAGLERGGGGWMAVFDDGAHGYALLRWIQVQWAAYNAANGEVWPAVGDLDNDGRAEIVAGLGPGGAGWFEIFDDASAGYAHVAFRRVTWPAYVAASTSVTHPAVGNVDGVGGSEIILGLGPGSSGWIEIVNGAAGNYGHRSWIRVNWTAYNTANGATFPAAGDVDGDGRDEIVAGLGRGGGGWLEVLEDGNGAYAHVQWLQLGWAAYNQSVGETHPAVGDVDGDDPAEIVVGLAEMPGQGGWFETFDDSAPSPAFSRLGWRNLGWPAFTTAGGATYPAIGRLR